MTTNVVENWFFCMKKREDMADWDEADKELVSKLHIIQTWSQKHSSSCNIKK